MIYQPREDSFLIASCLKDYVKEKKVLDLGTGSGILAIEALRSGAKSAIASDIDEESIKKLKEILSKNKLDIKVIHSNFFDKIKKNFDIIVCNPPYLPLDKREDSLSARATTGGKNGDEFLLKFLTNAPKHLNNDGEIIILLSSLTPRLKILHLLKKLKLKRKIIKSQKLFMEELEVWLIKKQ